MRNQLFEYHPDAIIEAHQAFHWYADRSEQAADRFWNELIRARALVTDRPQGWTPYFHGTRVFQLRRYPYGLVYVERPEMNAWYVIGGVSRCVSDVTHRGRK